ncbi:2-succinyl-6-hydroxy-2,4-cyclohexadiene-1-carboxy late synthase [Bacillus carboniphilus]|uniref:Putative 2-succinyl-6-hydroxy-2,4-cyclohexadiene-1-carboxylate synthase n=1 Tax=Bacillus carboniphilus TaxID=86663 RepID=A0ABN0W5L6_9BACI
MMNKQSIELSIRGVRYYLEMSGKGTPLWLLHGFTGSTKTWGNIIPLLCEHRKVISIDLIGHGKTESPQNVDRYKMEEQVKDLEEIRKALDLHSLDLLGYSMGGRVALSFAMTYRKHVQKLILESSSPGLEKEEERIARKQSDNNLSERIKRDGLERFVDYWQDIPLFQSQKSLPKEVQQNIRSERLQQNPIGLANSLVGMGTGSQPSWWQELKKLDIPTLLITGTLDHKFVKIAQEMLKVLPHAEQIDVFGVGHAIHVEEPEKFVKIVREFLLST